MKAAIELSKAQADRLRDEAERLGVAPGELARPAVADLLSAQREDFRTAAAYRAGEVIGRLPEAPTAYERKAEEMRAAKRKRLAARGWAVGAARQLLGLSDEEAAFVELKLALWDNLRLRRLKRGMTRT